MFRPAVRLIARPSAYRNFPRSIAPSSRFLSTAPPTQKSRSFKSLVARVGAAGAIIYYYNTTDVFAEEPQFAVQSLPETDVETEQLPTIDALAIERRQRREAAEAAAAEEAKNATATAGAGALEEEADQQGAFNPETGEINWDCPCLGGMAHGPCGEEFKAAFSCFVYSTEETKGIDCIDKFKGMQNCFREYPEIYGAELEPDEEEDATADRDQPGFVEKESATPESGAAPPTSAKKSVYDDQEQPSSATDRATPATEQVKRENAPLSESDSIPKAAFENTEANTKTEKKAEKNTSEKN